MVNIFRNIFVSALAMLLFCDIASSQIIVALDPATEVGPIKMMNAANNGPYKDNLEAYKALRVPYARTHDTPHRWNSHTVDINQLFPNWDANVNNPKSYDFTLTDSLLVDMMNAGTKPFFRLGQSIEHAAKKYGVYPPKDFKKWAKICEHVIRHYNEGWADGHEWNIEYWEIWNEADLDAPGDRWKTDPRCWGGSMEQFHEFYEVAAKHLKKCFPHLKIGGPAFANPRKYGPAFLDHVKATGTPLDFFSWHMYHRRPHRVEEDVFKVREILDEKGFKDVESILNEWNYVKRWEEPDHYSTRVRLSIKGAAFVAAVMSTCQNAPLDMLMYYDLRPNVAYNGAFHAYHYDLLPAYWALYYWAELADYGTQVKSDCAESDIYTTFVRSSEGKLRLLVPRYNEDQPEQELKDVTINVPQGYKVATVRLTDSEEDMDRTIAVEGNSFTVTLKAHAFALVDMLPME